MAIGSQDGSIALACIDLNNNQKIVSIVQTYPTDIASPITFIDYTLQTGIIYAQKNYLNLITHNSNSVTYLTTRLITAKSLIKYTSINNQSLACCDSNNNIAVMLDIFYPSQSHHVTTKNTVNSIYLHRSNPNNDLYLYIGSTDENDSSKGILEILKIDNNNQITNYATITQEAPVFFITASENSKNIIIHTAKTIGSDLVNNIISYPTPDNLEKSYSNHMEYLKTIKNNYESHNTLDILYNLLNNNSVFLFNYKKNQPLANHIVDKIKTNVTTLSKTINKTDQEISNLFTTFNSIFPGILTGKKVHALTINAKPYIENSLNLLLDTITDHTRSTLGALLTHTSAETAKILFKNHAWLPVYVKYDEKYPQEAYQKINGQMVINPNYNPQKYTQNYTTSKQPINNMQTNSSKQNNQKPPLGSTNTIIACFVGVPLIASLLYYLCSLIYKLA